MSYAPGATSAPSRRHGEGQDQVHPATQQQQAQAHQRSLATLNLQPPVPLPTYAKIPGEPKRSVENFQNDFDALSGTWAYTPIVADPYMPYGVDKVSPYSTTLVPARTLTIPAPKGPPGTTQQEWDQVLSAYASNPFLGPLNPTVYPLRSLARSSQSSHTQELQEALDQVTLRDTAMTVTELYDLSWKKREMTSMLFPTHALGVS